MLASPLSQICFCPPHSVSLLLHLTSDLFTLYCLSFLDTSSHLLPPLFILWSPAISCLLQSSSDVSSCPSLLSYLPRLLPCSLPHLLTLGPMHPPPLSSPLAMSFHLFTPPPPSLHDLLCQGGTGGSPLLCHLMASCLKTQRQGEREIVAHVSALALGLIPAPSWTEGGGAGGSARGGGGVRVKAVIFPAEREKKRAAGASVSSTCADTHMHLKIRATEIFLCPHQHDITSCPHNTLKSVRVDFCVGGKSLSSFRSFFPPLPFISPAASSSSSAVIH